MKRRPSVFLRPLLMLLLLLFLATQGISAQDQTSGDGPVRELWDEGEKALALGNLEEARETFQKALSMDPDNGRTWNYLGGVSFLEGDYYKALLRFKRAAQANPKDSKIFNNLATTYDNLGQYSNAIENYTKAINIDPEYALPYKNLGAIYAYKVKDIELAEKYWRMFLSLTPENEEHRNIREELELLR